MLSDFSRKLYEFGISKQLLDQMVNRYRNQGNYSPAGQINTTYDGGIQNRGFIAPAAGRTGGGSRGRAAQDHPQFSRRLGSRPGGVSYKAEGGEVSDETLSMRYDRPGIEQFISKIVGLRGEDLEWAKGVGKKYGDKEQLDGRGDAARHLALGWLAANSDKPDVAKKAIQAREYFDTDYFRELFGGKFAGKEMDLRNNELGMQIPAKTREEAEEAIQRMIESRDAMYMTPQESYEMRGYAEGGEVSEMEPAFLEALEQQRLREAAFDNEFGIEVAAQSNYAADIDPSIFRYHGFKNLPGDRELTLKGFYVPEQDDFKKGDFVEPIEGVVRGVGRFELPTEVGTVNAVHSGANPEVLAHEYRHKQFPGLSEYDNTLADAATALNESQWNTVVERFRTKYLKKGYTRSEAQEILIRRLKAGSSRGGLQDEIFGAEWDRGSRSTTTGVKEDRDDYIKSRKKDSFWNRRAQDLKSLKEYNEDLPDQNEERLEEAAAVRNYAKGGGVAALAPRAKGMFNTPMIKRGIGGYAAYTRRA